MKQLLTSLCAGLFLLACGGSTHSHVTNSNSCSANVVRQDPNSWLLSNPEIHFDFWGDWSSQTQYTPSYFESTWFTLIESDKVLSRLSEYGIHLGWADYYYYSNNPSPTLVGPYETVDGGPSLIDDSTIPSQLQHEIQFSQLPYPNDNTLYVVMLAPGITTKTINQNGWSGYHHSSNYGSQRFAYAVVTFTDVLTNVTISHEVAEAATDPGFNGYFDPNSSEEIGDLCNGEQTTVYGVVVQTYWSQALCDCQ